MVFSGYIDKTGGVCRRSPHGNRNTQPHRGGGGDSIQTVTTTNLGEVSDAFTAINQHPRRGALYSHAAACITHSCEVQGPNGRAQTAAVVHRS